MLEAIAFPAVVVATLCLMMLYWYRRPKDSPPGPRGLPLLGVIPFVGSYPERVFRSWSKHYGPIMTVRMGRFDWVVLNDIESINTVLVKNGHIFSGRPSIPANRTITQGHGLIMADYGKLWKIQRRFGMKTFREFGLGKRGMEDRIMEQTSFLTEEIRKKQGKAFPVKTLMTHTVANVISGIVFGKRFPYGDPWLENLIRLINKWIGSRKGTILISALMYANWLKNIPPIFFLFKEMLADVHAVLDILDDIVKEHKKTLDPEDIRDFIDAYLVEINKGTDTFTKLQLLHYIRELFEAGTETTTSTLCWSLLGFIRYPQMQEKFYSEIKDVIGDKDTPTFSMKEKMPYCNAFIQEVYRFHTLFPMSAVHCPTEDAEINGLKIKKGTGVLPNLWAVHNDPNVFDQPDKFDPGRHIDENGNFVKSKYIIPFSVGPRLCLGEQIAKMELFLFLTSMVQKFRFDAKPGEMPEPKGSGYVVFIPEDFELIATERKAVFP